MDFKLIQAKPGHVSNTLKFKNYRKKTKKKTRNVWREKNLSVCTDSDPQGQCNQSGPPLPFSLFKDSQCLNIVQFICV